MTNRSVHSLAQMEERSKEADQLISYLKSQINELKEAPPVTVSSSNLDQLKNENAKLKIEMEAWKQKLILAEIHKGIHQVPMPVINRVIPEASKVSETAATITNNEKVPSPESNEKMEKKPKEKNKNTEKKNKSKEKSTEEKPNTSSAAVDVSKLDFRIGKIVDVKKHPDADSLYVEEVDLGEGSNRTVVSGLVKHVSLEDMQNRIAVFLCNMKPAKMRGIASSAMIMCASTPEKVEILVPPANSVPGDLIYFKGFQRNPEPVLNPKKKIFETIAPDLKVNDDRIATYKGVAFEVEDKGIVVSTSLVNVNIK